MPLPKPFITGAELRQYTGAPLALADIARSRTANEGRFPLVSLSLPSAAPAGLYYSDGIAVTASTPGRTVYPAASPPFAHANRSFAMTLHSTLPKNVRLLIGREAAVGLTLGAAAATAFSTVTFTWAAATPEGYENVSRATPMEPFYLFDDSTAEDTGVVHFQLTRSATSSPYDPALDQGNAGHAVMAFMIPTTEGVQSGRATESAPETAGDGLAWVLIRPVYDAGLSPEDPLVGTGSPGSDDTNTPSFYQVGCLQSAKELNRLMEFAETRKNYNNDVTSRTISQNLLEINCNGTSKNTYLLAAIQGGRVERLNASFMKVTPTPFLQDYECLVISTNQYGYTRVVWIPKANLVPNGTETLGARGETMIPFQVKANEQALDLTSDSFYQMLPLIINCKLT